METRTTLSEVITQLTRNGNTRFVARDSEGREYTTFREEIGTRAQQLRGKPVRVIYHEERRGHYNNVYLDEIQLADHSGAPAGDTDAEEAAWRTAVEAAPWLIGKPKGEVSPDELYEKLKPFEQQVAEDIEESRRG